MKPYLKALYAGTVALLASLGVGLADGELTSLEVVTVVSAFVVAAGGTYFVPYESTNKDVSGGA